MRTAIRRTVATTVAVLGLLLASVVPAPAASGPGWHDTDFNRCPVGKFCLFDGTYGTGAMAVYSSSQAALGGWNDKASSMYNRTAYDNVCLFSETNFRYTDPVRHTVVYAFGYREGRLHDFGDYSYGPAQFANDLSSFRLAKTRRECSGGTPYTPWYGGGDVDATRTFGDLNRDGRPDLLQRNHDGKLWYLKGNGTGRNLGGGWNAMTALTRHGDLDGNGTEDLIARDSAGVLWFYPGRGDGSFGNRRGLGRGWNTMRQIVVTGDLNNDGRNDLLAVDADGTLWRYPGTGKGTFGARIRTGSGWHGMRTIGGAGDMNGDRRNDIVAVDKSGKLWLYPGSGKGAFGKRTMIGTGGWQVMKSVFSIGDTSWDGRNDLIAVGPQDLFEYPGTGAGRIGAPSPSYGWELSTAF